MTRLLTALCALVLWMPLAAAAQTPAAAPAASRTIVLVRHGHYAPDPTVDEALGPHVSALGVAQAKLAGAALAALPAFDRLHASPMQRARDTAAVIAAEFPGQRFAIDPDLAECTPPTRRAEVTRDETPESLAACKARLDRAFERYFRAAAPGDGADLLVCHGNVIRYLVTRALGVDTQAWLEMSVGHASITTIRVGADGRFKVIAVGDVGHMPRSLRTGATGDAEVDLSIPTLP